MKTDLHDFHLKNTPSRKAVLSVLEKTPLPVTAETVFSKIPGENLSTVYRVLGSFEKAGLVKKELNESGENSYLLKEAEHRHVIICVNCHKKIYLSECPYQKANAQIEKETGFAVFDHNVQLFGLCPSCQKKLGK